MPCYLFFPLLQLETVCQSVAEHAVLYISVAAGQLLLSSLDHCSLCCATAPGWCVTLQTGTVGYRTVRASNK